jgi:hypothetical protein
MVLSSNYHMRRSRGAFHHQSGSCARKGVFPSTDGDLKGGNDLDAAFPSAQRAPYVAALVASWCSAIPIAWAGAALIVKSGRAQ